MKRSQKFIQVNRRQLDSGRDYYNPDTSLMPRDEFETAQLKLLICFPSPSDVKAVSTTKEALNDYIVAVINKGTTPETRKVFIDFAYLPSLSDMGIYNKNHMPHAIGNVTHLDASHFDIVGFSISVLAEVLTAPSMIRTFGRCDNPIPMTWTERKDMPVGSTPILFGGGITASCGDIMFGELGDGRQAFLDFLYLGAVDAIDIVFDNLIKAKQEGLTNQQYIDTLFVARNIYQPQAYKVVFNSKNQIIENTKINPLAQDYVQPHYPEELPDTLGIGRSIINADGDACGVAQLQVSEGAMVKGTLIRTAKGLQKVEDVVGLSEKGDCHIFDNEVDTLEGKQPLSHAYNQGIKKARVYTTTHGYKIGLTLEHPVEQFDAMRGMYWTSAEQLKIGDCLTLKKGCDVWGSSSITTDEAEFLGRMVGDGSYNLYNLTDCLEPKHKMYLACAWAEREYCEDLLKRASVNYTADESQGRHMRFWILNTDLKGRVIKDYYCFTEFYKLVEGERSEKYIPSVVSNLTKEATIAFIKGYHDADGSASGNLTKLTFDSCHKSTIDLVQLLLLNLGIPSKYHYYKKHRNADEVLGFKDKDSDHHNLTISAEYFELWNTFNPNKRAVCKSTASKERIPFVYDSLREYADNLGDPKIKKRLRDLRNGRVLTKELADKAGISYGINHFFDPVVSIEEVEVECYDLTVPTNEKLIANGISIHNCSRSGCCNFKVSGETLVWTDKGILRIDSGEDFTRIQGKATEVYKQVQRQEDSKKVIVTTKDGHTLDCDESHIFMCVQGNGLVEKKTHELVPGDVILRKTGTELDGSLQSIMWNDNSSQIFDNDLAEFLGFMHGDGCFDVKDERKIWKIYMDTTELDRFVPLFNRYVPNERTLRKHYEGENSTLWVLEGNRPDVSVDLAETSSCKAYVPSVVFKSPKSVIGSYLRGYFQADGWHANQIGVTTTSKRMAKDVSVLLSYLGIDCTVRKNGYWDRHESTYDKKVSYYIYIPKAFEKKFYSLVGFTIKNNLSDVKPSNRTKSNIQVTEEMVKLVRATISNQEAEKEGVSSLRKPSQIGNRVSDHLLRKLDNLRPNLLSGVAGMVSSGQFVTDQIDTIEYTEDIVPMYDIVETESNLCVYDSLLTHQCHEGWYTGGWVEQPREWILRNAREAKKYSAAYKFKPFSFNVNYVTDYTGMLYDLMKLYPKVNFLNMRLEELGQDTDKIKMMKLIGSNRISAPMEGLSERLRNGFLNKNLSKESLDQFMDFLITLKMTDIKVGAIYTGYEEDQDFEWLVDFVGELKRKAASLGRKIPIRFKACLTAEALTPYPGIGLVRQNKLVLGSIEGYNKSIATELKPQGECEIMGLLTKDGTFVKGTKEHPFLVNPKKPGEVTSYKFMKDLKEGDVIYGRLGTHAYGNYKQFVLDKSRTQESETLDLDEKLAAVLGWYMGDGYLNTHDDFKTFGFCFSEQEDAIKETVISTLGSIGLDAKIHYQRDKKMTAVRVHNARFGRFLNKEFGHGAFSKRIPDEILQSPQSVQSVFINYYFAADGTVVADRTNTRVSITSVNDIVLQDLKTMLANMGIMTSLRRINTNCGEKKFAAYRLEIRQAWIGEFKEKVGIAGVKGSKIKVRDRKICKTKVSGFVKHIVEKVIICVPEDTYGITVDNGTYITNGLVSHNTPLVAYDHTPTEYAERKSAKRSYYGERWIPDEWYDRFKEAGVSVKVNGFRYSTFIEQAIINLGRSATKWMYVNIILPEIPVFSLRSIAKPEVVDALKQLIDPEHFFEARDINNYISLSHRIRLAMHGAMVYQAHKLVKGGVETEQTIRCLKTTDTGKTQCKYNLMKDDPHKLFADVQRKETGTEGDFTLVKGCEACATPEKRKSILTRPTPQTKNSRDITAAPRQPKVQKIRFILDRQPLYDLLNPNNTAHTFMAKFLQKSEELLDYYHSIDSHSNYWNSDPDLPYNYNGIQIVDAVFSDTRALGIIQSLVAEVNSEMKSVQIQAVREEFMEEKLKVDDYNVFRFESTLLHELFDQAALTYKGEIKIKVNDLLETKIDPELYPPAFITKGKVVGYFSLPFRYNPVLYIQGLLKDKRITLSKIKAELVLTNMMTVRKASSICKCGKESGIVSITSGKKIDFGIECLPKALLRHEINSAKAPTNAKL